MTGLLAKALQRVESLSREEQDAVAAEIMETLDDEEAWERSFRERRKVLRSPAREAREERRLAKRPRLCIEKKPTSQTIYLGGVPINLTALAMSQGLDLGGVSKILSGKRRPSLPYASKMARGLGMGLEDMLDALEIRHEALNLPANQD